MTEKHRITEKIVHNISMSQKITNASMTYSLNTPYECWMDMSLQLSSNGGHISFRLNFLTRIKKMIEVHL